MPFFAANWPKSLDRLAFHHCLDDPRLLVKPVADAMASLALFTAKSIAVANHSDCWWRCSELVPVINPAAPVWDSPSRW